ncbi:unnamed protein product [Moneuplotes crassus]|uniref:Uncharacterized protein n=1 Tax=Euplotes crassus TaxID=5936 RepID=A0AAD1Y6A2_EUPCR|nr:unnamed protein product [Moneuplotes crassus]
MIILNFLSDNCTIIYIFLHNQDFYKYQTFLMPMSFYKVIQKKSRKKNILILEMSNF